MAGCVVIGNNQRLNGGSLTFQNCGTSMKQVPVIIYITAGINSHFLTSATSLLYFYYSCAIACLRQRNNTDNLHLWSFKPSRPISIQEWLILKSLCEMLLSLE